jgi:hypothetical protein
VSGGGFIKRDETWGDSLEGILLIGLRLLLLKCGGNRSVRGLCHGAVEEKS